MKNIILFISFVFVLLACNKAGDKIPSDILTKEKMILILADRYLAQAHFNLQRGKDKSTTPLESYYNHIYKIHSTTEEEFNKSFEYYMQHPELLSSVYEEVITELSKREGEAVNY